MICQEEMTGSSIVLLDDFMSRIRKTKEILAVLPGNLHDVVQAWNQKIRRHFTIICQACMNKNG